MDASPVSQTATVTFDTARTSVADLARWVQECDYHCAGQSGPPAGRNVVPAARPVRAAAAALPDASRAMLGGYEVAGDRACGPRMR